MGLRGALDRTPYYNFRRRQQSVSSAAYQRVAPPHANRAESARVSRKTRPCAPPEDVRCADRACAAARMREGAGAGEERRRGARGRESETSPRVPLPCLHFYAPRERRRTTESEVIRGGRHLKQHCFRPAAIGRGGAGCLFFATKLARIFFDIAALPTSALAFLPARPSTLSVLFFFFCLTICEPAHTQTSRDLVLRVMFVKREEKK